MGLIKAELGAIAGVAQQQWKEYFYCEAMPADVLVCRGRKRQDSTSTNKQDNVITSGSVICVADGQCMMIVEQGKVVDLCAEPGDYTYDASTEPSVFDGGNLGTNLKEVFKAMAKHFTFGGQTPTDQRIYYFNTRELVGNKYGTPNPVPFRVVDNRINLDMDVSVKCFGEYSYKITNPILFYTNICGNVSNDYTRDELDSQLKTELLTALQPAFARISEMGVRYSQLPGHTTELANALNDELSAKWRDLRGIEIVSFGVSSVTANEEDEAMIKELQRNATLRDPNAAAAQLIGAQADAMKAAASNPNGATAGFMGMGMAQAMGGMNAQALYGMGTNQAAPAGDWTCACGAVNNGNFCTNCGAAKPAAGWTCECGTVNTGNFCTNCGKPRA